MDIYLRLLRYAKPYRWQLLGAAICMSLAAALNVGALLQLQPIVDKILSGTSSPAVVAKAIRFYPPLIVLLILFKGFFSFSGDVLNGTATNKLTADIREEVYGKLLDLPLGYHTNSRAGQLMSRVTSDVNLMPGGICDVLGRVFGAGLNIICIVGAVFWINWKLALIVLIAFPACFGPLLHFSRRLRRHSNEGQERMADMTVLLHETLAGIRVIMSFGTQPEERARFKAVVWAYYRALMRQIRASAASSPVMEFIVSLGAAAMIVVAGQMINEHTLTQGQVFTLIALLGSIYPQVKTVNGVNVSVQGSLAGSQRVFELLDEPIRVTEKPGAVEAVALRQSLRFEDVSYEYKAGHPVLNDISIEIPAGATVAS